MSNNDGEQNKQFPQEQPTQQGAAPYIPQEQYNAAPYAPPEQYNTAPYAPQEQYNAVPYAQQEQFNAAPYSPQEQYNAAPYVQQEQFTAVPDAPTEQFSAIPQEKKKDRTEEYVLFAVIATIIIAIVVVAIFFGVRLFSDVKDKGGFNLFGSRTEEGSVNNKEEDFGAMDPDYDSKEEGGLNSIKPFIGKNNSYTVENEYWEYIDTTDEGDTFFFIEYPVIKGLSDSKVENDINNEIESIAMKSRDMLYPKPIKPVEEIMAEGNYWLESTVEYKIAYMDENIISIVFEDSYFLGSVFAEYCDMRTVTFDLKTGAKYELDEFLDVSNDFLEEFRIKMIMEDPTSSVFSDEEVMSNENLTKILNGEILEGRYVRNYFLSAEGIDIGICYHYRSSDSNIIARGYTTTTYDFKEIEPFSKPHSIWDSVKAL